MPRQRTARTHLNQERASKRKKQRREERDEADRAEADARGMTAEQLKTARHHEGNAIIEETRRSLQAASRRSADFYANERRRLW